jgi:hypothetical protein
MKNLGSNWWPNKRPIWYTLQITTMLTSYLEAYDDILIIYLFIYLYDDMFLNFRNPTMPSHYYYFNSIISSSHKRQTLWTYETMSNKKDHKKFVSKNKNKSQVAKQLHEWCVRCTLSIYLWSWLVSFFCLSHSDLPNHDSCCAALGVIGKPSMSE